MLSEMKKINIVVNDKLYSLEVDIRDLGTASISQGSNRAAPSVNAEHVPY